jgi:hypothetical protein
MDVTLPSLGRVGKGVESQSLVNNTLFAVPFYLPQTFLSMASMN